MKITTLKGSTNYPLWSQHVERLLRAEGVWQYVDGRKQRPDNAQDEAKLDETEKAQETWDTKDARALFQIYSALSDDLKIHFEEHQTAKELWTAIKNQFNNVGYAFLYTAYLNMIRLRVDDFKTVEEFNQKFKMYLNRLSQAKVKLPPVITITSYLIALSDKFPAFTARIRAGLTLDFEQLPDLDVLMAQSPR